MIKHGKPDHPVDEAITRRWSPYGFSDKPVSKDDLLSLFEAARWAASSYNEQPWRFIVATKDNPVEFQKVLSCLTEPNQAWAKRAPVLILTATGMTFAKNDKRNRVAFHDLGLAAGNLCLEATKRGIHVHQMAGVQLDKVRTTYHIPDGFEPQTAIAIGYAADPETLDEATRQRDTAPRPRKPLSEWVFADEWGKTSPLVG